MKTKTKKQREMRHIKDDISQKPKKADMTKQTKNKGWEKTKTLSWEKRFDKEYTEDDWVGCYRCEDYDIVDAKIDALKHFINKTLAQELRGLLDEIEKEVNGIRLSSINTEYLAGQKIAFAKVTNILTKIKKRLEEK